MDSIVQLMRNALCIVRGLGLFQERFPSLWDATILPHYYDLPEPLNQTTPLELLIGLSQAYVTFSLLPSGWKLIHTSCGKYIRAQRILFDEQTTTGRHNNNNNKSKTTTNTTDAVATRLIHESLLKEARLALRSMFVGFLLPCIGLSFFVLFTNTVHVTETGWNGGILIVIQALIVTELALVPLLYYMWVDAKSHLQNATRLEYIATQIVEQKTDDKLSLKMDDIDLAALEAMIDWQPFWSGGLSIFDMKIPDSTQEEKLVWKEITHVQDSLEKLMGRSRSSNNDDNEKNETNGDNNDATATTTNNKDDADWQTKLPDLRFQIQRMKFEGYREYIYFILNLIALYSYMICIIVFYYDNEHAQPYIIRSVVLLGFDNASADWYGNFWGDLMWTIEPIIALCSPAILDAMKKLTTTTAAPASEAKVKTE